MIVSRNKITIITFLLCLAANAQLKVKTYLEKVDGITTLFIDNDEYCEVSVVLTYSLTNMKSENNPQKPIIVPSKTKKLELDKFSVINSKKPFEISYNSQQCIGNINQTTYDDKYKYSLPFKKGTEHTVFQGYNGSFSHKNENALDFPMDVGTEVLAIRDGVVIQVVTKYVVACLREECKQFNNYITVRHNDGTFAEYTHIKKNGSLVNIGDQVKEGQVVALSGNTGYSSGPHLHLIVYLPEIKSRKSLKTLFLTGDGTTSQFLKEKESYARNY